MAATPVSYDRIFHLGLVAGIGVFIFVLMWAMFENARARGLQEPFQYVFYAAGFVIFMLVLPRLLKRRE